jgi:hypothetical protein
MQNPNSNGMLAEAAIKFVTRLLNLAQREDLTKAEKEHAIDEHMKTLTPGQIQGMVALQDVLLQIQHSPYAQILIAAMLLGIA